MSHIYLHYRGKCYRENDRDGFISRSCFVVLSEIFHIVLLFDKQAK